MQQALGGSVMGRSLGSAATRLGGRRAFRSRFVPFASASSARPRVVLTREQGKNEKMKKALSQRQLECVELPLIEHTEGPDRKRLPEAIKSEKYDWVAITSPEAATVFIEAWHEAGKPQVRVAVVGAGTGEVLRSSGIEPAYTPSKALGKVMGAELPKVEGGSNRVLYPASAKASTDLQDSLTAAGFTVVRLNTYNTSGVKAKDVPTELLGMALGAQVVTFGSPSAVKAWVALVGLDKAKEVLSVCIGSTSAKACATAGLDSARVYYPADPGVDGWVECVMRACQEHHLLQPAGAAN